jgi:hypothetical protein
MPAQPTPAEHSPPQSPAFGGHAIASRAVALGLLAGFVYLLITGSFIFEYRQTNYAHHILMADAMLHGQLAVRDEALRHKYVQVAAEVAAALDWQARNTGQTLDPEARARQIQEHALGVIMSDWADHDGHIYGYWAPLAAVVAMPFVALFGLDVSDTLINALFGALNVGLFYWLLHRVSAIGLVRLDERCRVALTLLLAFGTSHFWLTCTAQVWFAVEVVTLTAMLGALLAACTPSPAAWPWLVAGALFGTAILGRNIVALTGLFFIALIWLRLPASIASRWRAFVWRAALFTLPAATAVATQFTYNYARFGDPLESGLRIQVETGGQPRFREAYETYGFFSLHYVPHNLKHYFVNWDFPLAEDGTRWFDREGNSLFLVTPPLLYALLCWRRRSSFILALLAGLLPLLVALLLYFATGYVQFGPRYLLDVMPLLLLLAAIGMNGRLTAIGYVLTVLAVAANLFGTYRLCAHNFALVEPWVTNYTLPVLVLFALLVGGLWRWWPRRAQVATAHGEPDRAGHTATESHQQVDLGPDHPERGPAERGE